MLRKLTLTFCIPLAIAGCGGGSGTSGLDSQGNASTTMSGTTAVAPEERGNAPAEQAASAARFTQPIGITLSHSGNLYVAGWGTVRKIAQNGSVSTLAGVSGEFANPPPVDGTGPSARFNLLTAITTDFSEQIYVTDAYAKEGRIRKITPGGTVTTLLSETYGLGVTADKDRNLYIANNFFGAIDILAKDGTVTRAVRGLEPHGIARDAAGNLYVLSTGRTYPPLGQNKFSCTLDKISPSGVVTTLAGKKATAEYENTCGHVDGTGAEAKIGTMAHGLTIDSADNLYFTDTNNHTIRKVTPDGVVTTLAGLAGNSGSNDGTGSEARFNRPNGITVDAAGNLYVADTQNHTIRKLTPTGVVTTFAGKAGEPGSTDAP